MTKAKEHIFLCDILGQYTPQTSCTITLSSHVFAASSDFSISKVDGPGFHAAGH